MTVVKLKETTKPNMAIRISDYVQKLTEVLQQIDDRQIAQCVSILVELKKQRRTLFICGNGGSAANAIHLANDFTFGISPSGDAISVEALPANSSVLTCLGNDIGYNNIFAHQLKVKAKAGDVLLVLTGSGNSENILEAVKQADEKGMTTIGIIGYDGGKVKSMLDLPIHMNIADMQISEDTQVIIGHILMQALLEELN